MQVSVASPSTSLVDLLRDASLATDIHRPTDCLPSWHVDLPARSALVRHCLAYSCEIYSAPECYFTVCKMCSGVYVCVQGDRMEI